MATTFVEILIVERMIIDSEHHKSFFFFPIKLLLKKTTEKFRWQDGKLYIKQQNDLNILLCKTISCILKYKKCVIVVYMHVWVCTNE